MKFKTFKSAVDDATYEDCKFIVETLNDEERKLFGYPLKDSPYIVFRRVLYTKDTSTPIGFIQLYDTSLENNDPLVKDVNIALAVNKNFRHRGIGLRLVKEAFTWFKKSDYETMSYIIRYGNESSERLAIKCGFGFILDNKKLKEKIYMITNPSRPKAISESKSVTPIFVTQPQIPQGCVFIKYLENGSAYFYDPDVNMCMRTLSLDEHKIFNA